MRRLAAVAVLAASLAGCASTAGSGRAYEVIGVHAGHYQRETDQAKSPDALAKRLSRDGWTYAYVLRAGTLVAGVNPQAGPWGATQ